MNVLGRSKCKRFRTFYYGNYRLFSVVQCYFHSFFFFISCSVTPSIDGEKGEMK